MVLPIELLSENFVQTKNITINTPYRIFEIDARELLCPSRIDLAAKIAYIEAYESNQNMDFAKELYRKHIQAFSEGYYIEPGDKDKTSLESFFATFDALIEDFKVNGFDKTKSLIPVGKNNIILDGAHRTACAIYFRRKVTVISFENFAVNFDYTFFRSRKLSDEMLEYMAKVYSQWSTEKIFVACLWPVADKGKRSHAIELIHNKYEIVFQSDIELKKNGLRNFMLQIYQHQEWIGNADNHFEGVMGKVNACFSPSSKTTAILFIGDSLDNVLKMKDQIRDVFGIGKHAIHISDTNEEARLMASLLFQNSTRHALNYGRPDLYPECYRVFKESKGVKNVFFSEKATLAYYGLSDNADLTSKTSMVLKYDPRSYFTFDGIMMPSLENILKYKEHISSADYQMVEKLVNDTMGNVSLERKLQDFRTTFSWKFDALVLRLKQIAMKITSRLGVYEILHRVYHRGE